VPSVWLSSSSAMAGNRPPLISQSRMIVSNTSARAHFSSTAKRVDCLVDLAVECQALHVAQAQGSPSQVLQISGRRPRYAGPTFRECGPSIGERQTNLLSARSATFEHFSLKVKSSCMVE
jgi:hypothetical protein